MTVRPRCATIVAGERSVASPYLGQTTRQDLEGRLPLRQFVVVGRRVRLDGVQHFGDRQGDLKPWEGREILGCFCTSAQARGRKERGASKGEELPTARDHPVTR
jgi:hypothetical protein